MQPSIDCPLRMSAMFYFTLMMMVFAPTIHPMSHPTSGPQLSSPIEQRANNISNRSDSVSHMINSIINDDQLNNNNNNNNNNNQQQQRQLLPPYEDEMSNDIHMGPSSNTQITKVSLRRNSNHKLQQKRGPSKRTDTSPLASTTAKPTLPMPVAQKERQASKWTVEIRGGPSEADQVAKTLNCINLGLVKGFQNIYLLEKKTNGLSQTTDNNDTEYLQRDKRDFRQTGDLLRSHKNVVWVEPQTILTRVKRSYINLSEAIEQAKANKKLFRQTRSTALTNQQTHLDQQRNFRAPLSYHTMIANRSAPSIASYAPTTHSQQNSFQPPIQYSMTQLNDLKQQQFVQSERKISSNGSFVINQNNHHPYTSNPLKRPPNDYHYYIQDNIAPTISSSSAQTQHQIIAPAPTTTAKLVVSTPAPYLIVQNQQQQQTTTSKTASDNNKKQSGRESVTGNSNSPNGGLIGNHNIGLDSPDLFSRGHSPSGVSNEDRTRYDDELWQHQWYMQDNSNNAHIQSGMHLHVQDAWNMGYTGKNVVVTVIDDGIEWNHTDLIDNYDPLASYDMNNNDPDPFPRYDAKDTNSHGTRCAGEIAMAPNNKKCGVGVAPKARIGGIKSLDGDVSDHIESMSLIHNLNHVDIYSGSWGPKDDGMTLEGPRQTTMQALRDGIERGRQGKGALYVWANGNGGISGDNCNCDGYVSSLYTLAVGSVTQKGQFPFYGERCASTLAVTCSSGSFYDKKVTTTDLHNRCTTDYSGTSAAAPLAAGILALVLEANPNITWRDAQYLVVWTSDYYPLKDNNGWFRNKAGLMFNNKFGFGLMNAKALVESALTWQNVPQKSICTIFARDYLLPERFSTGTEVEVPFYTDGCERKYFDLLREKQGKPVDYSTFDYSSSLQSSNDNHIAQPVNYLEHVQVIVTIEYPVRGDIDIFLTSPSGTTSNILTYRPMDKSFLGFTDWALMSVHFWGERPHGTWMLRVRDKHRGQTRLSSGYLVNATLILHGTTTKPAHMNRPRIYDGEDQIKDTLEKSTMHMDIKGRETYDENPWDQNDYPNDMSQVSSEVDEERLVTARMLDNAIMNSMNAH